MKRLVASLALGLMISSTANAAPAKKSTRAAPKVLAPRRAAPTQALPAVWNPRPFTGVITPGYEGEDAYQFFKVFKAAEKQTKKDEFETTAAFEARMSNPGFMIVPIDPQATYAFRLDVSTEYDADRQVFVIGNRNAYNCERPSMAVSTSPIVLCGVNTHRERGDDYVGQNAYGASVSVSKTRGVKVSLPLRRELVDRKDLFYKDVLDNYSVVHEIPMPLAQAAALKGKHIDVLFIGKVSGAQLIDGRAQIYEPTVTDPMDVFIRQSGLPLDVQAMWFYVLETGEVLEKFNL